MAPQRQRKFLVCRLLLLAAVHLSLLLAFTGCSRAPDPWASASGQDGPKVLVSFPPLYCFTKAVAGEHARVLCLTTSDPHEYRPDSRDIGKARDADVLIYIGLSLDEAVARLPKGAGNARARLVNLGELLEKRDEALVLPIHGKDHDDDDHDHGKHGHDHGKDGHQHHGEDDPHVWLGIDQARALVDIIAEQLSAAAPEHKKHYRENASAYRQKLDELHEYGKKKLGAVHKQRIVATHDSMQYFAKAFDLKVVSYVMPQPGVQAGDKEMRELIELCTKKDAPVRIITVEVQYTDRAAQNLLKQIEHKLKEEKRPASDVPVLVPFDTLETVHVENFGADYYLDKMRQNIDKLAEALP
jgi:ABC-type Zn uptake system ZnuABC Zn-binding protein ZnuA